MKFPFLVVWSVLGILAGLVAYPAQQGSNAKDLENSAWSLICYVVGGAIVGLAVGFVHEFFERRKPK